MKGRSPVNMQNMCLFGLNFLFDGYLIGQVVAVKTYRKIKDFLFAGYLIGAGERVE